MERFEKQPSERFAIYGDFSENMVTDETIVSHTVTAVDASGADATNEVLQSCSDAHAGQIVQVVVQTGETSANKTPYKITFRVTTSTANKWELDVKMKIKDS